MDPGLLLPYSHGSSIRWLQAVRGLNILHVVCYSFEGVFFDELQTQFRRGIYLPLVIWYLKKLFFTNFFFLSIVIPTPALTMERLNWAYRGLMEIEPPPNQTGALTHSSGFEAELQEWHFGGRQGLNSCQLSFTIVAAFLRSITFGTPSKYYIVNHRLLNPCILWFTTQVFFFFLSFSSWFFFATNCFLQK